MKLCDIKVVLYVIECDTVYPKHTMWKQDVSLFKNKKNKKPKVGTAQKSQEKMVLWTQKREL